MENKNYNPCTGCSGEDCPACEVWIERQADMRADQERDPAEYEEELRDYDAFGDFYGELCHDDEDFDENDCDESMDGDFDSGMASAGFGYDEQYEHDTPIGDFYDDMGGGFED